MMINMIMHYSVYTSTPRRVSRRDNLMSKCKDYGTFMYAWNQFPAQATKANTASFVCSYAFKAELDRGR